jgi:hypothetical protein
LVQATDPVTISVPRKILASIVELSSEMTDRMHQLLEKNTDGDLGAHEKAELESLVRIAELGQITASFCSCYRRRGGASSIARKASGSQGTVTKVEPAGTGVTN